MKKIQQFYVLKLNSGRIINAKYNITLDLNSARRNGEVVSVAQNQVIESLFSIKGKTYNPEEIKDLFIEKRKLKKKESSPDNINALMSVEDRINEILFIPEIISIAMDKKQHYAKIIKNGIRINDKEYVRLMCGSGHARRNTSIFIQKDLEKELKEILNNGRDVSKEIVYAKNNAYFALAYSGKQPVSQPYFCVVPDCETKRVERVDFIDDDLNVIEKDMELDFNLFDGQGLISPEMASQWAKDLDLDYVPSAFIIRNSFLKGMVCVFDFHKFSNECGVHIVKDVWGADINIRDMDLVLTASQFKAWNSYSSCKEYEINCKKNNMSFGITRVTPKQDSDYIFTNYQFLQVLNLDQNDIENLCKKTIEYLDGIVLSNPDYALLYLLGKISNQEFDDSIFNQINDNVVKALLLNRDLLHDPYIQKHLLHSLNKKIKDSYIGKLIVDGNYTMIVSDPYAFCEHLFSLPVNGLLKREEHYSGYWNAKGERQGVACRAPLTWRSEILKTNFIKNDDTDYWYNHLNTGVLIYNVHGCDSMYHADSD